MDVTIPFGQPNRDGWIYGYNLANNVLAPGYQQMYDSGDPIEYNDENGWQIFSGKNQSKNGVYGKHGSTQSPPIPYQGKLYLTQRQCSPGIQSHRYQSENTTSISHDRQLHKVRRLHRLDRC